MKYFCTNFLIMVMQLASGKSISISLEEYLSLTDNEISDMIANEQGFVCNHPFTDSVLILNSKEKPEEIEEEPEDIYNDQGLYSPEDLTEFFDGDSYGDIE